MSRQLEIRELGPDETALAYDAMLQLRPAVGSEADFVDRVNKVQRTEGYRLVVCFVDEEKTAAAVAGFRIVNALAWGKALYVDDLSTRANYRRRGCAGALLDWLVAEALRLGCDQFHLDSGVQPERTDAHRLYFNKGMRIGAYHFQMPLPPAHRSTE